MELLKNFESDRIHVSALIVSDFSPSYDHWDAKKGLSQWLQEQNVPAVYGVDTRSLTKQLREKGTMLGKIIISDNIDFYDPNKENLVKQVSVAEPIVYNKQGKYGVVVIDCGVKYNILRSLIQEDCKIIRVPCDYDFFHDSFEAVVISNGPGDPKTCQETIGLVKKCLIAEIPILGICLGNQIMALAAGADTYKLKYGHRSQNQPSIEVGTKRCYITSQNHGYAVNPETLPQGWEPWFTNINDNTNEGIRHKHKPFLSVQFHPEHNPGPVDTRFLFDVFMDLVRK
jgi:carbamoyl-phosphate synthase small subunit